MFNVYLNPSKTILEKQPHDFVVSQGLSRFVLPAVTWFTSRKVTMIYPPDISPFPPFRITSGRMYIVQCLPRWVVPSWIYHWLGKVGSFRDWLGSLEGSCFASYQVGETCFCIQCMCTVYTYIHIYIYTYIPIYLYTYIHIFICTLILFHKKFTACMVLKVEKLEQNQEFANSIEVW